MGLEKCWANKSQSGAALFHDPVAECDGCCGKRTFPYTHFSLETIGMSRENGPLGQEGKRSCSRISCMSTDSWVFTAGGLYKLHNDSPGTTDQSPQCGVRRIARSGGI